MDFSFKQWMEDAGHTDWGYGNASDPAFDQKIPSKWMARDFKGDPSKEKKLDPKAMFGKRMKKRMKNKMKKT